jgi:hypothetical protein
MTSAVTFKNSIVTPLQNVGEQIAKHANHSWHYIKHRDLFNGLPFSVAAGAGCAYLFNCCHPGLGALYGALSYTILTLFLEAMKNYTDPYYVAKGIGVVLSYAIPTAFMYTVVRVPIPLYKAAILAGVALIGQIIIFRCPVGTPDEPYHYGECVGEEGVGCPTMTPSITDRIFRSRDE